MRLITMVMVAGVVKVAEENPLMERTGKYSKHEIKTQGIQNKKSTPQEIQNENHIIVVYYYYVKNHLCSIISGIKCEVNFVMLSFGLLLEPWQPPADT